MAFEGVLEIGVGVCETGWQWDLSFPAESVHFCHVEEFAGGAVGFGGVEGEFAGEADGGFDEFGEFADGDIMAAAEVDPVRGIGGLHEVEAAGGEVVDVEELASGRACAPNDDLFPALLFGFMEAAEEGGDDVGVFGVVVVARAVEVGGHGGVEEDPVLGAVVLAEFEAGDFGDGVGFIGGLEGTGEEAVFGHGWGGLAGVDAGAAEEENPLHTVREGRVHQVGGNHEILVDEVCRVGAVGVDATDFGGGNHHGIGTGVGDEGVHGGLGKQVQFLARGGNELYVRVAGGDGANQGTTDHTSVTCDENGLGFGESHAHEM